MTPREAVGLTLGAVVVIGLWTTNAKRQGALAEKLRVADSVQVEAVRAHKAVSDSALQARLEAANLRDAARREVRRDAIAEARTDSSLALAHGERQAAEQILRDSLATVGVLRGTVAALLTGQVRDSIAFGLERLQHQRSILALGVALAGDSVALSRSLDAEQAAVRRAVAAESQRDLAKRLQPGFLRRHLSVSVGYGATVSKGEIRTGPSVSAGLKIF